MLISRAGRFLILSVILFVGGWLRFQGLYWDELQHFHPDERYISWVGTTIELPSSLKDGFNPHTSEFNPFYWHPDAASDGIIVPQDQARKYAYGHLPLYLGVAATRLSERLSPVLLPVIPNSWTLARDLLNAAGRTEYNHLTLVSRALTALFDLGTVLLVYWLGKRLFSPAAGLLASALLAFTPLHIQLARFFIADPFLTFFCTLTLLILVIDQQGGSKGGRWLAAVSAGLAVGCKFVGGLLVFPLAVVFLAGKENSWMKKSTTFLLAGLLAALAFAITNPFALRDLTCTTPRAPFTTPPPFNSCFLADLMEQRLMASGSASFPFTRQYDGTLPYIYQLETLLRWGMGPLFGLAGLLGLSWMSRSTWKDKRIDRWVLVAFAIPYFLMIGAAQVKFMRYMLPMAPILAITAAALLLVIHNNLWRWLSAGLTFISTCLLGLSLVNMLNVPHPWLAGRDWLDALPPESIVLGEAWDEPVHPTVIDAQIDWLVPQKAEENDARIPGLLSQLADADYYVISSSRVYEVLAAHPERYPLASRFHPLLLDGSLGYELIYASGRAPTLDNITLWPQRFAPVELRPPGGLESLIDYDERFSLGRADESFLVYDQPLVMIFENVAHLYAEELWLKLIDQGGDR